MEGKKLQEILRKNGIKQVEVAKLLGITEQSVSSMMRSPSVKSGFLEKIIKEFGLDSLIDENDSKTEEINRLRKEVEDLKDDLKQKENTIQRLLGIIEKRG